MHNTLLPTIGRSPGFIFCEEHPRSFCPEHRPLLSWYFPISSWTRPRSQTGSSFLRSHDAIPPQTWERGRSRTLLPISGWHSTRLPRAKPCEATWLRQLRLYRQTRRLFLSDGNKLQILSLRAFSQPLFQLSLLQPSSLSNCICQHCRENCATCWWALQIGVCHVNTDVFQSSVLSFRMTFHSVYCD